MTTPLIEACARALFHFDTGWGGVPCAKEPALWEQERAMYLARARAVIPLVLDAAAEVANGFDWEVYGDRIAEAILALKPEAQS